MTIIQNALITVSITDGGTGFNLFQATPILADGTLFAYASASSGKIVGVRIDSPGSGLLDGRYVINGETIDIGYVDVVGGQVVSGYYVKDQVYSGNPAVSVNIPYDFVTWPSSSIGVHTLPSFSAIVQGPLSSVIPIWNASGANPVSFGLSPVITFTSATGTGATFTPVIQDYTVPTSGSGGSGTGSGTGTTTPSTVISASKIAEILSSPVNDIFVREAISADVEIDFPDDLLVNDLTDFDAQSHGYGWRAWVNPTQTELNEDLKQPDNIWEPVFGNFTPVSVITTEYLKKIKTYQESKLLLNTGTEIEKYQSIWSEYKQLNDIFIERIFDGQTSSRTFDIATDEKTLVKSRLFLYINGILQPTSAFQASKLSVTIANSLPINIGAKIVLIYKKYSPSSDELSFDPTVKDDILVNTQYKFGYDYSSFAKRDATDKLGSTSYYFWVKNKNTPAKNRKMSVQQAKNLLQYGPSLYMTFHHPIQPVNQSVRYDSISIFGLNKIANRDDTFKLRFTRNFTLRDDPNELDLKNVHAEWKLLRPAQNTKIPSNLWDKLVESAVGADPAGNILPAIYLSDYDSKHGTSNRFGLGKGQVLADKEAVLASIKYTILNTKVTLNLAGTIVPDYIQNLKLSQLDKYFDTQENIRKTLDSIWRTAKPKQINEIFFAVINDALANNSEFKDVFKTSRLSVYSIKTVDQILTGTSDE